MLGLQEAKGAGVEALKAVQSKEGGKKRAREKGTSARAQKNESKTTQESFQKEQERDGSDYKSHW